MADEIRPEVVIFVLKLMQSSLGRNQVMISSDLQTPSNQIILLHVAESEQAACKLDLEGVSKQLEKGGVVTLLPADVCRIEISSRKVPNEKDQGLEQGSIVTKNGNLGAKT